MGRRGLPTTAAVSFAKKPWVRIVISLLLASLALYFLTRSVNLTDVQEALSEADFTLVAMAVITILMTILMKVWRWYWMFKKDEQKPGFVPLYRALVLGQFFNVIFPLRIGEVARVYSLEIDAGIEKARSLTTIVIEKTLDLLTLLLSGVLLIPFIVLPDFIVENGYPLALVAGLILISLVLLAYRAQQAADFVKWLSRPLPRTIADKINKVIVAGLKGLESLMNWRLSLWLGFISFLIIILSFLVPYILFLALDFKLGLAEAVLINLVATLGIIPPSTPGKVLVFEGIVILMLRQFGIDDPSLALSYAVLLHLVVAVPQIVLGTIAFARGGYRLSSFRDEAVKTAGSP